MRMMPKVSTWQATRKTVKSNHISFLRADGHATTGRIPVNEKLRWDQAGFRGIEAQLHRSRQWRRRRSAPVGSNKDALFGHFCKAMQQPRFFLIRLS